MQTIHKIFYTMNFSKAVKSLLFTLFLSTTAVMAQQMQMPQVVPADSVSDEELALFVDTAMQLQGVRMQADNVIMGKLEEEGMTVQRFQEIMVSQQNPNAPAVELTAEEEETITTMSGVLQEVSMNAQQQQMQIVESSELTQQRFQSIAAALQQDQELAARFQQMAMEMEQGGNQ